MNNFGAVFPSSQVDSTLPQYIVEQYQKFVNFMTVANEAQERIGFGQDILQNLQKYRDFNTYQNGIVKYGILAQNIESDSEELILENGYGFPEENGVLLIDNEIILYRTKEDNTFYELKRGSAGTTVLPTFTSIGTYLETCPAKHISGTQVTNLSVLFLSSMLEIIYETFADDIDASKIHSQINQTTLLSNIRDFFQSKGTKLGIQSLFKMIFADTSVDVKYPGDQIIIPSVSTYVEDLVCRTVPIPATFYDPNEIPEDPGVLIGSIIQCKSYNDDVVYGEAIVEYTKSYPYQGTIQYDLLLNSDSFTGEIIANPSSYLTTKLFIQGSSSDPREVTTVTVHSTNKFPDSGILFIENEGIFYASKTDTTFENCIRGYIGQEVEHEPNITVHGPYYVQGDYLFQAEEKKHRCDIREPIRVTSRSWPIGLVSEVTISDSGLLHSKDDEIIIQNPDGSIRTDIQLRVADISSGNISDVFIQEPGSPRSAVGDLLYFDNTGTFGGGAEGRISWIEGECVEESIGCEIATKLISHRQLINLSNYPESKRYVFIVGQFIETFGTGNTVRGIVTYWDGSYLVIQVTSPNLIKPGDLIIDSRGNEIEVAPDYKETILSSFSTISSANQESYEQSNLTMLDYVPPTKRWNGSELLNGDLWWAINNGRLYIYYDGNWVSAQPYGTSPMGPNASNASIGVSGVNFIPTGNPPLKSQVIISDSYPTESSIGSPLRVGDLWWSSVTGILYIWNSDRSSGGECVPCRCEETEYDDVTGKLLGVTSEWVCTDPTGMLGYGPQGPTHDPTFSPQGAGAQFEFQEPNITTVIDVQVHIGDTPPAGPDGILWWSNVTGRMYIKYESEWVVTNPIGTLPGAQAYAPNGTADNSGPQFGSTGPIVSLPEVGEDEEQQELFFTQLCDFYPEDNVLFDTGEEAIILQKNSNLPRHSMILRRGPRVNPSSPNILPDGIIMRNTSRFKITLETEEPHNLSIGDIVRFDSLVEELNDREFEVIDTGYIIPASGTAILTGDEITDVIIDDPGDNYTGDFYITFIGGGGIGAAAIARVDDGKVISVDMISTGGKYDSIPELSFKYECSVYFFSVYTDKLYPDPQILSYDTTSRSAENYVADIEIISGGIEYQSLPSAPGFYKREIDRASFKFSLSGTSINTVEVLSGGARYVNPKAIIIDPNGKGKDGEIDLVVSDGVITAANVINPGIDYENPYIIAIDEGVYIPETTNIGQIQTFEIIKEGRGVNPDPLVTPIVFVETKLILTDPVPDYCWNPIPLPNPTWTSGDEVTIGSATAVITNWNSKNQILSVNVIRGQINNGDTVSDAMDNTSTVRIHGQSVQTLNVSGATKLPGRFITDKSLLNKNRSRLQDGKYYQRFSYVIESSIERAKYETIVNDIVHPAGFVYFSNTKIEDYVMTQNSVDSPIITIP